MILRGRFGRGACHRFSSCVPPASCWLNRR